jgi:light-regulated signal transduction histidine kinase (bacteriophytochrome)/CheY-like chemotaxis protein
MMAIRARLGEVSVPNPTHDELVARTCDSDPIHVPASIQPHGVLLSVRESSLVLVRASLNSREQFGLDSGAPLGRHLEAVLDDASVDRIRRAKAGDLQEENPLELAGRYQGGPFDGILYRSGDELVIELEPRRELDDFTFRTFYRRARSATQRLRKGRTLENLAQFAADEVRELTGFDRVMIYRFHQDGSGEVVAESRKPTLGAFLGLRFPGSDIPAQARRLYLENWLRLIVDASYEPVRIATLVESPLDLSRSVLRSVSPVHRQYLRNMGVRASMSVSLVVDGKLWGLIACHHETSRFVPFEARTLAEFLGEALSWQIGARERSEALERETESQRVLVQVVERIALHASILDGVSEASRVILELTGADGGFFFYAGELRVLGEVPSPPEQLQRFRAWLTTHMPPEGVFASSDLGIAHPEAPRLDGTSGVLAIELSKEAGEYLVWRRGETARTVDWAGKPEKKAHAGQPLTPRASFEKWTEEVRGQSLPWTAPQVSAALELRSALVGGMRQRSADLARLNEELRTSNLAKDEFLATVSHELRTPLNAMLGWLSLLEDGRLPESKRGQAMETIMRNARSQAQLVEDLLDVSRITSGKMRLDVRPVELVRVVESALESVHPMAEAKGVRLQAVLDPRAGPVMGDPQRLQQVVWNLLTNAVKFTPRGGKVQIRARRVESSVEIGVSDDGAGVAPDFLPFVFDRFRQADGAISRKHQGLGLGLSIVKHLVELHGGRVSVESAGEGKGATFNVLLPLALLSHDAKGEHPVAEERRQLKDESLPPLVGLRVLVVDDEPDATDLMSTVLARCKIDVATASSGPDALALLPRFRPHIILSDIGMPGMDGLEFIRCVRALPPSGGGGTLAVAITAFARTQDRSRAFLAGFDVYLPKPVDPAELLAVLVNLAGRLQRPTEEAPEFRITPTAAIAPEVPGAVSEEGKALASRSLDGAKVLIVDDDDDNRDLLEEVFRGAGAKVRSAGLAATGIELAREFRPDVLITDIGLPDGDGYGVLRTLRASAPQDGGAVPAIALTGSATSEDARRALLEGFQLHISKPVDIDTLIDRVTKLLGGSARSMSPAKHAKDA